MNIKCDTTSCYNCMGNRCTIYLEGGACCCMDYHYSPTNADRIRAMTDDELVNWIADIKPFYCQPCVYEKPCRLEYDVETVNYAEKYDCKDGILKWLQQPAEEDDHES